MGYNINFILIQLPELVSVDTKTGRLLKAEGLPLDVSSVGRLRLNRVQQKLSDCSYTVIS